MNNIDVKDDEVKQFVDKQGNNLFSNLSKENKDKIQEISEKIKGLQPAGDYATNEKVDGVITRVEDLESDLDDVYDNIDTLSGEVIELTSDKVEKTTFNTEINRIDNQLDTINQTIIDDKAELQGAIGGVADDVETVDQKAELNAQNIANLNSALEGKQPKGNYALKSDIPDISGLATQSALNITNNNVDALTGEVENIAGELDGKQPKGDYALKAEIPTNNNQLENGAGYQTASDVASAIAQIPKFQVKVVQQLPETGEKMVLYLVPKTSASGDDIYDEFVWIETTNKFEPIGSTTVDLSDYVKNTDYATASKAGVFVPSSTYSVNMTSAGRLTSITKTLEQYNDLSNVSFISKGTLENIKENLVTSIADTKYQPIGEYATKDELNLKVGKDEFVGISDLTKTLTLKTSVSSFITLGLNAIGSNSTYQATPINNGTAHWSSSAKSGLKIYIAFDKPTNVNTINLTLKDTATYGYPQINIYGGNSIADATTNLLFNKTGVADVNSCSLGDVEYQYFLIDLVHTNWINCMYAYITTQKDGIIRATDYQQIKKDITQHSTTIAGKEDKPTITKSNNKSGVIKHTDGRMEQWGLATSSTTGETEFTINANFIDTDFQVFIEPCQAGDLVHYAIPSATNKFKARIQNTSGAYMTCQFQWRAYGFWK